MEDSGLFRDRVVRERTQRLQGEVLLLPSRGAVALSVFVLVLLLGAAGALASTPLPDSLASPGRVVSMRFLARHFQDRVFVGPGPYGMFKVPRALAARVQVGETVRLLFDAPPLERTQTARVVASMPSASMATADTDQWALVQLSKLSGWNGDVDELGAPVQFTAVVSKKKRSLLDRLFQRIPGGTAP